MAWSLCEVILVGIWPANPYTVLCLCPHHPTLLLGCRTSYSGIILTHIEFPLGIYWPSRNHCSAWHQRFAGEGKLSLSQQLYH